MKASRDNRRYDTTVPVLDEGVRAPADEPHACHGDWNYTTAGRRIDLDDLLSCASPRIGDTGLLTSDEAIDRKSLFGELVLEKLQDQAFGTIANS